MRATVWENSRRAYGGLVELLSGFRAFSAATQGRAVTGRKCDGSSLGWIIKFFQDWGRIFATWCMMRET